MAHEGREFIKIKSFGKSDGKTGWKVWCKNFIWFYIWFFTFSRSKTKKKADNKKGGTNRILLLRIMTPIERKLIRNRGFKQATCVLLSCARIKRRAQTVSISIDLCASFQIRQVKHRFKMMKHSILATLFACVLGKFFHMCENVFLLSFVTRKKSENRSKM